MQNQATLLYIIYVNIEKSKANRDWAIMKFIYLLKLFVFTRNSSYLNYKLEYLKSKQTVLNRWGWTACFFFFFTSRDWANTSSPRKIDFFKVKKAKNSWFFFSRTRWKSICEQKLNETEKFKSLMTLHVAKRSIYRFVVHWNLGLGWEVVYF